MGQYQTIINISKREYIRIGGAKLWEQAHDATAAALLLLLCNSNGRGGGDFNTYPVDYDKLTPQEKADEAIVDLASGRWAGDSIVVQGDYAEPTDPGFVPKEIMETLKDVTPIVCDALLVADNGDNSEVAQIIESEHGSGFGAPLISNVKKIKRKCRNKQTKSIYSAKVATKPTKKRGSK